MKAFNIRKLKIYVTNKERELKRCDPKSRDRLRGELKAREIALAIAMENRRSIQSSTEQAVISRGFSPESGVAA